MKTPFKVGIAVLAVGVVAASGWHVASHRHRTPVAMKAPPKDLKALTEVEKSPKTFIAKNENSKDIKVQTLVTRARMTDAYNLAKKKDYTAARTEFVEASYMHKGTDAMSPDYGTLPDQAAYQAIVCLDAEGKRDEARKEYRKFMEERKLSPLIHACFRRLERLNGKPLEEDQALLESGIAAQEDRIKFETSVCGPKCLEKVLPILGAQAVSYKELAKLCGTTEKGTTMEGLKKGAEKLGLKPVGLELNNQDFLNMKKPFIWIQADHYLAVLEIKNNRVHIYDPRFNIDDWRDLPKEDDPSFRAQVLAFEVPTNDLVSDHKTTNKS